MPVETAENPQTCPPKSGGTLFAAPPEVETVTLRTATADDAKMLGVIGSATFLEAFTWATADDQIGTELRHGRSGVAGEVYEILMQEEPDPEELRG